MTMPTIIVHGGAGAIHPSLWPKYKEGAHVAARAGQTVLDGGGAALDAAIAAVLVMEESPVFNAGRGSALTNEGKIECDAFVMTDDLLSGGVAAVRSVRNPVLLARVVMDHTPHKLIVGRGAEQLAINHGLELVNPVSMIVERRWQRFLQLKSKGTEFQQNINPEDASDDPEWHEDDDSPSDTVGACAIDAEGRLAVASSTGGIMMKLPGRVGDTPIVGAGSYCGRAGAVTCTGHGEAVMRLVLSKYAYDLLEEGKDARETAQMAVEHLVERISGFAGMIVLDAAGNRAWATSTNAITTGIPEAIVDQTAGWFPNGGSLE
jgi:beta-aspartyl-peptidase (threonine type)